MMQAILWFNVLGFSLMCAAFVLALLYWIQGAPGWLKYYLLYHLFYMAWLAIMTFASFNIYLLGLSPDSFGITISLLHSALSAGILLTYPPLILKLTGTAPRPRNQLPFFLLPIVLIAVMVFTIFYRTETILVGLNVTYNALLLFLSAYGLRAMRRQPVFGLRAVMKVFLRLSLLLYLFVIVLTPLFFLIPRDLSSSLAVFFNGLFCFIWGTVMTVHLIRRFASPEAANTDLPEAFKDFYRITRRESEILELLLQGKGSQEIGDALFISRRTVETHLYNIYRKTRAANRVELINRIRSF
jgi:DNA-binding CsgD family transcriptional regulator